ncbi:hypothetical protein AB0H77_13245 [Streptomyces sp. NPDC050844]|uniref:hypothetical protein n=1 Tax=Streptomyces sp. NPDC050844 TaxID=3155790 RepID=UPI0033EF6ED9
MRFTGSVSASPHNKAYQPRHVLDPVHDVVPGRRRDLVEAVQIQGDAPGEQLLASQPRASPPAGPREDRPSAAREGILEYARDRGPEQDRGDGRRK